MSKLVHTIQMRTMKDKKVVHTHYRNFRVHQGEPPQWVLGTIKDRLKNVRLIQK